VKTGTAPPQAPPKKAQETGQGRTATTGTKQQQPAGTTGQGARDGLGKFDFLAPDTPGVKSATAGRRSVPPKPSPICCLSFHQQQAPVVCFFGAAALRHAELHRTQQHVSPRLVGAVPSCLHLCLLCAGLADSSSGDALALRPLVQACTPGSPTKRGSPQDNRPNTTWQATRPTNGPSEADSTPASRQGAGRYPGRQDGNAGCKAATGASWGAGGAGCAFRDRQFRLCVARKCVRRAAFSGQA
jgi:hypothetical protein